MPDKLTSEEAAFLKNFAQAGAAGKLWLCIGYRALVAIGAVVGAIGGIGAGIVWAWHGWSGGR